MNIHPFFALFAKKYTIYEDIFFLVRRVEPFRGMPDGSEKR